MDSSDNDVIERYSVFVDGLLAADSCDYLHDFREFEIVTRKHDVGHSHEACAHYKTDVSAYDNQLRAVARNEKYVYYYSPTCRLLYNYSQSVVESTDNNNIRSINDEFDEFLKMASRERNNEMINSLSDLPAHTFPRLCAFIDNCCLLIARNVTNYHEIIILDLFRANSIFSKSTGGAVLYINLFILSLLCLVSQNNLFPFMQIYVIGAPKGKGDVISDALMDLVEDYDASMVIRSRDDTLESRLAVYNRLKHYIHILHVKFKL